MKEKSKKVNTRKELTSETGGDVRKTAIRFRSLVDIRRFLARVLNDLDGNKIGETKARTFGYLCSVMRDIIKDSDLEARVLKLEEEAKKRESA